MCAYGGNKDNLLFLDIVLGEGRGLVDTHSPRHTLLCTAPWLQQAQVAGEMHSLGGMRTHSLKTPDPWDTHDLEGQKTEWVQESWLDHYHAYLSILRIYIAADSQHKDENCSMVCQLHTLNIELSLFSFTD